LSAGYFTDSVYFVSFLPGAACQQYVSAQHCGRFASCRHCYRS
jgi:hypothetical protein